MRRLLHMVPGAQLPVARDPGRLAEARADEGWIWLDVGEVDAAELANLAADFGFDHIALEDVLEPSEFPKLDEYEEYLFVVLHSVASVAHRITARELDLFVGADYLVTAHREDIAAVDWLWEEAQQTPALSEGGPDRMLARIAEAAARRVLPLIDALEVHLEDLEDRAVAGDPRVVGELQALRRDAIVLRRITGPQRAVLNALTREGVTNITHRARLRLENVDDLMFRIVESLDSSRALLATVLDTYRSTVAENMNEVMKVLTVFSAILLPLSVMAGIYGMNFANIPELGWRWGYFALLGVMGVTVVGLWLYFAWRGFIGGPRLHRLPRVVGRGVGGLLTIGTAPVRFVAHALLDELGGDSDRRDGER